MASGAAGCTGANPQGTTLQRPASCPFVLPEKSNRTDRLAHPFVLLMNFNVKITKPVVFQLKNCKTGCIWSKRSVKQPVLLYSLSTAMNTLQNLRSRLQFFLQPSEKTTATVENAALALWLFAVVASTLTHELWRDETREYLMAIGTDSLADYFTFAKYDGHPLLWRTILMAMHALIPHPVALQMASLVIGFFTVYLIVKHSPFPLFIKTLFIFGIIPFSVNTVDARDYGISMLLFFAIAIFYSKTDRHPLIIGILLFLQANTNQYGMYLSCLFLAAWIADSGFHVLKDKRYLIAAAIALAGVLISYLSTQVIDSVFISPEHIARINWGAVIVKSLRHPGEYIHYILHIKTVYRDIFVIGLIIALFVVRPYFGMSLFLGFFFFNVVAAAFIYPNTRHQGVLIGFMVMLYWIALHGLKTGAYPGLFKNARIIFSTVLVAFLIPFLIEQIRINSIIVHEEAAVEKSTAQAVGKYLITNRQLEKAIIIGSPDYALEPIAFYSKNNLYLVQEKTFRNFVEFAREFEQHSSLSGLLASAEELNAKYKVPIIIVLGHFGVAEGKSFGTIYRGMFVMNHLDKFKEKTIKLAEFNRSLGDENFQVFLYLPPDELRSYRQKYMEIR